MFIRVLPKIVSNYIAAGEVIHCSASVVKELIENSIDAGSTRIDIDIENGGLNLINIRDNGCGICKDDLVLSLSRHSTSKIYSIQDLESVTTLGFRGEALASINSVSRLTLSSCHYLEQKGWSICSFGQDLKGCLQPIAHTQGTTLTILDLFFNQPVRRKFVKSGYFEFVKIDEVVRRLSLSNNQINICLKHNNKLIRYYPASNNDNEERNRVNMVCGFSLTNYATFINREHDNMKIRGWIYIHINDVKNKHIQYCYVNYRIVYNNIIRHSVLQAVKDIFGNVRTVSYILYFNITPNELDINIHPDKKQVSIFSTRIVYGFVYQSIVFFLKKRYFRYFNKKKTSEWVLGNKLSISKNNFLKNKMLDDTIQCKLYKSNMIAKNTKLISNSYDNKNFFKEVLFKRYCTIFGNLLLIIKKNYLLIENNEKLFILSLPMAQRLIYKSKLELGITSNGIQLEYFSIPNFVIINPSQRKILYTYKNLLLKIGLQYSFVLNAIQLHSIPSIFIHQDIDNIFFAMLNYFIANNHQINLSTLIADISNNLEIRISHWNDLHIIELFSEFKKYCQELIHNPVPMLLQPVNIDLALLLLKT